MLETCLNAVTGQTPFSGRRTTEICILYIGKKSRYVGKLKCVYWYITHGNRYIGILSQLKSVYWYACQVTLGTFFAAAGAASSGY